MQNFLQLQDGLSLENWWINITIKFKLHESYTISVGYQQHIKWMQKSYMNAAQYYFYITYHSLYSTALSHL